MRRKAANERKNAPEADQKRARWRDEEYRRHLERLRLQIEEARKRRHRLRLLVLLILLALLISMRPTFSWLASEQQDESASSSSPQRLLPVDKVAVEAEWMPSPEADYAPRPGEENHCDGYSFQQWTKIADARGISMSSRAAKKRRWDADPQRELYPLRYQDWGYKPYLGEIMDELRDARWGADAFLTLKIMSPPEVHQYLDEAYVRDPADIRLCRADFTDEIIRNLKSAAFRWEARKRRDEEEARRQDELGQKHDMPRRGLNPL
ncbi:hypothetical protein MRS76_13425 [Rhizobiaceae bacterium n13]|uniref:hypothetical protein n=1 Tax=Ferirhizobium litorale TaxID=2927786 RepID=UPI0024B30E9E|nr:hypothetical protein [Fererhizobium litorale]MDI7862959.1 hypothetical protein [Fererhizobium litorale]